MNHYRPNLLGALAATAIWLASSANAGAVTLAQSNFDSSAEGWTIFADGTNLTHVPTGGNPGGYISITDSLQGGAFNFVAPAAFLGNKATAYAGVLRFSLSQQGTGPQVDTDDVTLVSGALTLVYDAGANPAFFPTWSAYSVSLLASAGWKVGTLSGPAATESQLQQVLTALDSLRIRGEFIGGTAAADTGHLDSVLLESGPAANVPEPSALALLGAGLFFAAAFLRRLSLTTPSE